MNDVIVKKHIYLDTSFRSQREIFEFIADRMKEDGRCTEEDALIENFYQREQEFSTAMNDGIAIPHCRCAQILDATVMIIRNSASVCWSDDNEADLFFALLIPEQSAQMHIRVLASVAQMILEDDFIHLVRSIQQEDDIYEAMKPLNTLFETEEAL